MNSSRLIVLELELVLELGAISQAASAATRVHRRQILTSQTSAIEFEDEDEFEDDFFKSGAPSQRDNENKILVIIRRRA